MQQPAYCPRILYIGAGLLQRYDGSNGPMWNLLCRRLLSPVSRYADHPCFLSSLSPAVSCCKDRNNIRGFHRGMGCEMAALLIYLAMFSMASPSAPSICPLTW